MFWTTRQPDARRRCPRAGCGRRSRSRTRSPPPSTGRATARPMSSGRVRIADCCPAPSSGTPRMAEPIAAPTSAERVGGQEPDHHGDEDAEIPDERVATPALAARDGRLQRAPRPLGAGDRGPVCQRPGSRPGPGRARPRSRRRPGTSRPAAPRASPAGSPPAASWRSARGTAGRRARRGAGTSPTSRVAGRACAGWRAAASLLPPGRLGLGARVVGPHRGRRARSARRSPGLRRRRDATR